MLQHLRGFVRSRGGGVRLPREGLESAHETISESTIGDAQDNQIDKNTMQRKAKYKAKAEKHTKQNKNSKSKALTTHEEPKTSAPQILTVLRVQNRV